MKKTLTLFCVSAIAITSFALTVIQANTPLKNKKLTEIVTNSVSDFLSYEGREISGGLDGELENPTITEVVKDGDTVVQITVKSEAFFYSADHDFGDPVHEEETFCTSVLKKGDDNLYSPYLTKTICDFDPSQDIDEDYYEVDPCCDGGPVVDSNMCFDYYEEGLEYCGLDDEDRYDDYDY